MNRPERFERAAKELASFFPKRDEDWDRYTDLGPCPCYDGSAGAECICDEEARRISLKCAIKDLRVALAEPAPTLDAFQAGAEWMREQAARACESDLREILHGGWDQATVRVLRAVIDRVRSLPVSPPAPEATASGEGGPCAWCGVAFDAKAEDIAWTSDKANLGVAECPRCQHPVLVKLDPPAPEEAP